MEKRRKKRLREYIDNDLQGDRGALIGRSGLSKGRITQLLDDDEAFGERAARSLEQKLHLRSGYFDEDPLRGRAPHNTHRSNRNATNAKGAAGETIGITGDNFTISTQFPPVPVISWVIAGNMNDIDQIPDPDVGEWPMETPTSRMGPRSWVLVVEGDSMDDGTSRAIPAGYRIFCDPDIAHTPNCLVIAKNVGMQRATFKQLITEDGKWFLKAWNKDADFGNKGRMEIDDPELRVIAVVTRDRAPDRVY